MKINEHDRLKKAIMVELLCCDALITSFNANINNNVKFIIE